MKKNLFSICVLLFYTTTSFAQWRKYQDELPSYLDNVLGRRIINEVEQQKDASNDYHFGGNQPSYSISDEDSETQDATNNYRLGGYQMPPIQIGRDASETQDATNNYRLGGYQMPPIQIGRDALEAQKDATNDYHLGENQPSYSISDENSDAQEDATNDYHLGENQPSNSISDEDYDEEQADDPVSSNYYFGKTKLSYADAEKDCQSRWPEGGHLASISNEKENRFLMKEGYRRIRERFMWIGLNDIVKEGHYVWADGKPLTYKNWNKGEPNNWRNIEDCGHLYPNGKWNDYNCRNRLPYVCKRKPKYYFSTIAKSYSNAQADCKSRGGNLASISNAQEQILILTAVKRLRVRNMWIGLNDIKKEGNFVWEDGKPLTYKNWNKGEPNNWRNREDCAHLFQPYGKWNDIDCSHRFPYVCEFSKSLKFEYFVSSQKARYQTAQENCKKWGGNLASVNSKEEMAKIAKLTSRRRMYWIGLNDIKQEGKYVWTDGNPITFTFWNKGEPNNWGNREDCVHLIPNGRWNDLNCLANLHYVCKRPVA